MEQIVLYGLQAAIAYSLWRAVKPTLLTAVLWLKDKITSQPEAIKIKVEDVKYYARLQKEFQEAASDVERKAAIFVISEFEKKLTKEEVLAIKRVISMGIVDVGGGS